MWTHSQPGTELPSLVLLWFVLQLVHLVSPDLRGCLPVGLVTCLRTESRMYGFPSLKGIKAQTGLPRLAG